MSPIQALILGVIEGLTEFLPVSSTGHLILAGQLLGIDSPDQKEFADAFEIVIQLGALVAVLVHYRSLLAQRITGLARRDPIAQRLALALLVAFVPAAALGFLFHKRIEAALFTPVSVAGALIVGGVLMVVVELARRRRGPENAGLEGLEHVTPRRALAIGLGQCLALWPGASRSMTTIVAGQLSGLGTATAAEFSFLLAIPTLGAATVFKLVKSRHVLLAPEHGVAFAIGMVVSFLVAWGVIAAFLRYLRRYGLVPFGVYRVALGALVLVLLR